MRRFITLFFLIFTLSGVAVAQQMSDDQVVQYVKDAQKMGKTQKQITTELMRRGVTKEQVERIQEKYEKIREKLPEIDAALNEASKGWKTSRMGKVELSILRLAVYELRYDDDVPGKVAINEAVELAKKFGGSEAPAFINGVLGKLAKEADE